MSAFQPDLDLLSPVLQDLRLVRASYCRTDMTAPWGIQIPRQDGVCFHFVVDGECWLRLPSHEPFRIGPGDVALLPRGTGHAIADAPTTHARPLVICRAIVIAPSDARAKVWTLNLAVLVHRRSYWYAGRYPRANGANGSDVERVRHVAVEMSPTNAGPVDSIQGGGTCSRTPVLFG
ncbi:cupin domain-containing protein [Rhizobacter sp. OV335]|uniref:cupin domain-containing protein n=1 Tax=Rhizobacter sp. OV335 TaxID=1500264 RepID=UPI000937419B